MRERTHWQDPSNFISGREPLEDDAYARIHIGSSIPYDEFYPAVVQGIPYGGRSAERVVADVNKDLIDLYRLKYLPGAIMIRMGAGGTLADKKSGLAALDALEAIMRNAGAKDFGRLSPKFRRIVERQEDGGVGYTPKA